MQYKRLKGLAKLESIIPIGVIPNFVAINAIVLKDLKGNLIVLNFSNSIWLNNLETDDLKYTSQEINESLNLEIEFDDFFIIKDEDLIKNKRYKQISDYIKEGSKEEELYKLLSNCEINEVIYDCSIGVNCKTFNIPLALKYLKIGNYKFNKKSVNKYNKNNIHKIICNFKSTIDNYADDYMERKIF